MYRRTTQPPKLGLDSKIILVFTDLLYWLFNRGSKNESR